MAFVAVAKASAEPRGLARPPVAVRLLHPVDRTRGLRPEHAPSDLIEVPKGLGLPGQRLRRLPLAYFAEMARAVRRRLGRQLMISSGYRSFHDQHQLFQRYVRDEMRQGMSRRRATRHANTYSALPGHSEHQLGTTIDLIDRKHRRLLQGPDKDPKLQRWLRRNAWRYGFVNSYPPGRSDPEDDPFQSRTYKKTGYVVEPWHWRFVGKRAARHHHTLERRARHRITTHEFLRKLARRRQLRRRLERPHPADRRVLARYRRRFRHNS